MNKLAGFNVENDNVVGPPGSIHAIDYRGCYPNRRLAAVERSLQPCVHPFIVSVDAFHASGMNSNRDSTTVRVRERNHGVRKVTRIYPAAHPVKILVLTARYQGIDLRQRVKQSQPLLSRNLHSGRTSEYCVHCGRTQYDTEFATERTEFITPGWPWCPLNLSAP